MNKGFLILLIFAQGVGIRAYSEEAEPTPESVIESEHPLQESPPAESLPTVPETSEVKAYKAVVEKKEKEPPLIQLGARVDGEFVAGDPVAQGFAIPSLLISASGAVGKWIDYVFSMGETREYSTALLPQLLPNQAYVTLGDRMRSEGLPATWRFGMMYPSLNPWWSADLADVPLPDKDEVHKVMLLGPDIGTELTFQTSDDSIKLVIGAFNGNGIVSLNTNNTRAYDAELMGKITFPGGSWILGTSAYGAWQSSFGMINYKATWAWDAFTELTYGDFIFGADAILGDYQDPTHSVAPLGGSVFTVIPMVDRLSFFGRCESLTLSPVTQAGLIHWQLGPILTLEKRLKAFLFYDSYNDGTGLITSGQVRLRLTI